MIKYALGLVFCTMLTYSSFAEEKIYRNKLNTCVPTKSAMNNYEPEKFQPSNNLLHKAGAMELYCGEKILLKGKVLDMNCVPVSDAKVYLWQVGCDGKYPYKPMRKKINHDEINLESHSSFQGSGMATTNNKGEFQFITIRPPAGHAINARVEHMQLGALQTAFAPPREDDCGCGDSRSDIYDFTIVMDKADLHRRY